MLVRPLSPELAEQAARNLNESPKRLQDGIQHLQEWISKQPHLRARTDDQWLAAFLRGCKYSMERAKAKLDLYYSLRTVSPDLFTFTCKDQRFQTLLQSQSLLILPATINPGDPRIVLARPALYDPNMFEITEWFSFTHLIQQVMYMEDDVFMVNGSLGIVDLKGVTMSHIMQLTPVQIKKLIVAGQDASPLRVNSIHFVNCKPFMETMFNLAIKLLNAKHKERIHLYSGDASELYDKYVDKRILPTEYGGTWGSSQDIVDYWNKKFNEYGSWFDEDMQCGTDESKRPGKPKTSGEMFGVEGSFRKLNVD